jgi:hypothetical protein
MGALGGIGWVAAGAAGEDVDSGTGDVAAAAGAGAAGAAAAGDGKEEGFSTLGTSCNVTAAGGEDVTDVTDT